MWLYAFLVVTVHCSRDSQFFFSTKLSLKIDPTILFTHLKIILLQYFQFLIFSKICSIQTLPIAQKLVALSLSN